jgi:DnaK suppressor protein
MPEPVRQQGEAMSPIDTKKFRKVLERKHKDLLSAFSNREEIAIEVTADEMERLQQQLSREIAIRSLDQSSRLLKNVKAALSRLDEEIFGVCLRCEEPIHEKRLKAVPWASHCVACQAILDREHSIGEEDEGTIGFAA